jgi:hypothetical protein
MSNLEKCESRCADLKIHISTLEARIDKLQSALCQISEDESIDAGEMRFIAHDALTGDLANERVAS